MSTSPSPKLLAPEDLEHAVDRLALAMPLATSDQPFGPEHTVYRIGGKMFAMYTEGIGYPIVNLKTDPEESEVLRRIYPSIIPAWHMNKRHWISVPARHVLVTQGEATHRVPRAPGTRKALG